jgi:hypothetical protein
MVHYEQNLYFTGYEVRPQLFCCIQRHSQGRNFSAPCAPCALHPCPPCSQTHCHSRMHAQTQAQDTDTGIHATHAPTQAQKGSTLTLIAALPLPTPLCLRTLLFRLNRAMQDGQAMLRVLASCFVLRGALHLQCKWPPPGGGLRPGYGFCDSDSSHNQHPIGVDLRASGGTAHHRWCWSSRHTVLCGDWSS